MLQTCIYVMVRKYISIMLNTGLVHNTTMLSLPMIIYINVIFRSIYTKIIACLSHLEFYCIYWLQKLECIRQKFVALFHNRLFSRTLYYLCQCIRVPQLHTLRNTFILFFFYYSFLGIKLCPSLLSTANLRVPSRKLRDYSIFSFGCPPTNCLLLNAHQLRIWFAEVTINQILY